MNVLTLLLLTLPSCWSMPAEWSPWSSAGSQDGNDASSPTGDSGDFVPDLTDGFPDGGDFVDLIDGVPDGGLAPPTDGFFDGLGPIAGFGLLGGGAAVATLAGLAASTGFGMKLGLGKKAVGDMLVKNQEEGSDKLLLGGGLDKMGELVSENGDFRLLMEEGGNLVISGAGKGQDGALLGGKGKRKVVWSTKTAGVGNTYFQFKEDGDLVVLNGANSVIWNSGTGGLGGKILQMRNDGFLVLLGSNGEQIWHSSPHTLIAGQTLHAGYVMASSNGNFEVRIQGGDLGVYWVSGDQSSAIWKAGALGAKYLTLQKDGNAVLFSSSDEALWQLNTKGQGQFLSLEDDGKLELCCKKDGGAFWNSVDGIEEKQQTKPNMEIPEMTNPTNIQSLLSSLESAIQDMKQTNPNVLSNMEIPEMINPTNIQSLPSSLKNAIQDMKQANPNVLSNVEIPEMINPTDILSPKLSPLESTIQDMKQTNPNVLSNVEIPEMINPTDIQSFLEMMIQNLNPAEMTSQAKNFDNLLRDGKLHFASGWSVWSEFTACSATCGPATKTRERVCIDPANEETMCQGPTAEIFNCNLPACGEWSSWSDVTECSATCGPAVKTRRRTCTDNSNGGLHCLGSSEESIDCDLADCPETLDGVWSAWSDYTACSASCGSATKSRLRTCSHLHPANGDQLCQGPKEEIADCNLPDCQVTGGEWSGWSDFGTCSATCGPATKRRERTCTGPETSAEGLVCQGPKENVVDCNLADCPFSGGWSAWSDLSACSATCGPAIQTRTRTCTQPEPSDGGSLCQGLNEETVKCDLPNCEVDGGWSEWSDFGACSATCGPATKRRTRTCTQPEPSEGGQGCQGLREEVTDCNFVFC